MPRWRILAAVAALAGYALLSHWLMVHAPARSWTVAALFGPLLGAIGFAGLKRRHVPTLLLCAALATGIAAVVATGGVADVSRLYVLEHAAFHLALAWSFAMTLRPGSKALITTLAERVHTEFTPAMRAYTRWLTGVWVLYFVAMVVVSLLVYAGAPWPWWSFYGNVVTPLAALAFFVGETLVRRLRHPDFEAVTMARAIQAYRAFDGR